MISVAKIGRERGDGFVMTQLSVHNARSTRRGTKKERSWKRLGWDGRRKKKKEEDAGRRQRERERERKREDKV